MAKPIKDIALVLRHRSTGYDEDGNSTGSELHLASDRWPPRHEFTDKWLMRAVSDGNAKVSDTEIELTFANAHAVYRIVADAEHGEQIGDPGYKSTGTWGYLVKGEVS